MTDHESIRRRIEDRRRELLVPATSPDAHTVELDQSRVGRLSRMDAMQQQSVALSTRQHSQLTLKKIEAALNAFVTGDYGYCRRCDEAIGFGRLQAKPESTLCLTCQAAVDEQ